MTKLNVGLVGYYGWGNYGDEFFKDVLETELADCNFKVLHDLGPKGELILDNLEQNVAGVDVVMIGGGDLVIPFALSNLYWRQEFLAKPVVVYGVGVPRWGGYDADVVQKMREFFQHPSVRKVTARDQESTDWIAQHLKPSVPVVCAPDIVCAYQHHHVVPRDRTFGLVLRHQGNGVDNAKVRLILDAVRARGYQARLLMLATDKTLADDFDTVCRLRDLGDVDIVVRSDLEAITNELLSCDRVASMKFHGCVVALSHNVPCLALSAANKFKNFYADLGKPEWVSSLADAQLAEKLEAFLDAPRFAFPASVRAEAREGLHALQSTLAEAAAASDAAQVAVVAAS